MKRQHWIIAVLTAFAALSALLTLPEKPPEARGTPSAELVKRVDETDHVRRTDYVDADGRPAYARDRHYATLIKTRDDAARTVLEEYLDETGAPTAQPKGYCAILRAYDARNKNTGITYLDDTGAPVDISDGYARIARGYDDAGRLASEFYFDATDGPVECTGGYHGFSRAYPGEGGDYRMTYLGLNERPVAIRAGYAAVERRFDDQNRLIEERYFDADGAPCRSSLGEYGLRRGYDADGRVDLLVYLDARGNPAPTRLGYAQVRQRYNGDGALEVKTYHDAAGNPTALTRGEYGMIRRNDTWEPMDADGRVIFSLNRFLRTHAPSVFVLGLAVCLASLMLSRRGNVALLALYLLFIAYMTLMYRDAVSNRLNLELFWSYRLFLSSAGMRREILFNLWLFVPLGLILYRLTERPWAALIAVAVSAAIELTQYALSIGLCELDDIVSNGLGGGLGCLLGVAAANLRNTRQIKEE